MTTVKFTENYDYRPSMQPMVMVAYKAGMTRTVTRECAEAAVAAGKAQQVSKPNRKDRSESKSEGKGDGSKA